MLILVIALVVLLYFSNIFSYSMGIKHGRIVKDGGKPEINVVKTVKEHQQAKKEQNEQDLFVEGLNNIMAYGNEVTVK